MAWGRVDTVTVDKTKVPNTDQTNFPVGIIITDANYKSIGNGGYMANGSAYDIKIYSDAGLTMLLKYERVGHNLTTGAIEYHVKVPTLTTATNYVFYIAFGDASITTDQSDRTNVWDTDFRLVAHMGDGTTIVTNDSSSYSYTGTNNGVTADTGAFAGGTLGGSGSFASDYIDFGDNIASAMTGDFTLSYWGNATNWTQVFSKSTPGGGVAKPFDGYIFYTGQQRLWIGDGSTSDALIESAAAPTSTWTKYTWRLNGTAWTVRKNGAADNSGTTSQSRADGTESLLIGHNNPGSEYFAGKLDEMRASGVYRSDDWDTTEYNNQSSPSTFMSHAFSTPSSSFIAKSNKLPNQAVFNASSW